jgi:DNA-binding transcriptional ArsR family regulator
MFNQDDTQRIAKALTHPVRHRILEIVAQRGEASPTEIHQETGEPLGTVSYHTRALVAGEYLELRRIEARRGASEHFYGATPAGAYLSRIVTAGAIGQLTAARSSEQVLTYYVDASGAAAIAKAVRSAERQIERAVAQSVRRLQKGGNRKGRDVRVVTFFGDSAATESSGA